MSVKNFLDDTDRFDEILYGILYYLGSSIALSLYNTGTHTYIYYVYTYTS